MKTYMMGKRRNSQQPVKSAKNGNPNCNGVAASSGKHITLQHLDSALKEYQDRQKQQYVQNISNWTKTALSNVGNYLKALS